MSGESTFIKGARMRIELAQGDQSTTIVYDLPGGATIVLDRQRQRAESRSIESRAAELERQYPRAQTSVTLTPTGATKPLAGASCAEHVFSVRVPMTKDGEIALLMSGSAWSAAGAPGAAEYESFVNAAIAQQVVLGPVSNNKILAAVARGQTELRRALGALPGIPYQIDLATSVEGHGVLAGMVSKVVSGTQTSTVTTVIDAPIADSMFSVPEGWTRGRE